jgi:hypothetical protein
MVEKKSRIRGLYSDWMGEHARNWADEKGNRENFLRHILRPVEKEMRYSLTLKGHESSEGRKVSAREAYDLFKELAQIQEDKGYLIDASESWYHAGRIAEMAKAPDTSKKLFLKSAEALEKLYGPTTHANFIWDRQRRFKQSGNAKRYAEIVARDNQYLKDNNAEHGPLSFSTPHAFYEAGEYNKAADSAPHTSTIGMRSLKKAGRYEELAKAYDSIAENYAQRGNKELASRFEINARKIRQKGLEKKLMGFVSGLALIGSLFFLSTNVTGNVIADFTTRTTSFLGAGLLIVGLIAGFFWLKSGKK